MRRLLHSFITIYGGLYMKCSYPLIIIRKILLLLAFCNTIYAADNKAEVAFQRLPKSQWGVQANIAAIEPIAKLIKEPVLSATGKSFLTANKMDFDVLHTKQSLNSWVVEAFLTFSQHTKSPILDIGAGYGGITLMALKQGNKVIANDIALDHLLHIQKSAKANTLNLANLYLHLGQFPQGTSFPPGSLHAVMLHRVVHFMSPEDIEAGLDKIARWLKPGGKVFIVVMAPQHPQLADRFLPIYNARWQQGDKWPGTHLPVKQAFPDQSYHLPEFLHVMDERPLTLALKKAGFIIEKAAFVSMAHFRKKDTQSEGREALGIIAIKMR